MPDLNLPLPYLPVDTDSTANLLQKDAVWDCLKEIRKAGCEGITAKEISENTGQPQATVYGALDRLRTIGFVRWGKLTALPKDLQHKIRERIGQRKIRAGKTPRVYFEPCEKRPTFKRLPGEKAENPWGDIIFSRDFSQKIGNKIETTLNREESNLKKEMIDFTVEMIEKALQNPDFNVSRGKCPKCGNDHGTLELAKAVAFYTAAFLLTEDKFQDKLDQLK